MRAPKWADTTRTGVVFVGLFVSAFVLGLGTLLGQFADPETVSIERFADESLRTRDIVSAYLLAFSSIAFAAFTRELERSAPDRSRGLRATGALAAGGMMLGAVSFVAVPLSRWFGSLVDDPGLTGGEALLSQFAYVALAMGAMVPAAWVMLVTARSSLLPRWLEILTFPAAALVAFTAVLFMPFFIFIAWMVAVAVTASPRD